MYRGLLSNSGLFKGFGALRPNLRKELVGLRPHLPPAPQTPHNGGLRIAIKSAKFAALAVKFT